MITIIDYDIGNIAAIVNMLHHLSLSCKVTSIKDEVIQADRIILPGNGSFDACMQNLRSTGLIPILEEQVLGHGVPLMGICVGAQMLGMCSDEGKEPGLGWLDMQVVRFPAGQNLRIPHMGWNLVDPISPEHPLTQDMDADTRFYFVHSYYMKPIDPSDLLLHTHYGFNFASGVARGNIAGVQFHPEKSHRFGKQLLATFAKWAP
jgi:glutamine amidotransferase